MEKKDPAFSTNTRVQLVVSDTAEAPTSAMLSHADYSFAMRTHANLLVDLCVDFLPTHNCKDKFLFLQTALCFLTQLNAECSAKSAIGEWVTQFKTS